MAIQFFLVETLYQDSAKPELGAQIQAVALASVSAESAMALCHDALLIDVPTAVIEDQLARAINHIVPTTEVVRITIRDGMVEGVDAPPHVEVIVDDEDVADLWEEVEDAEVDNDVVLGILSTSGTVAHCDCCTTQGTYEPDQDGACVLCGHDYETHYR